MSEGVGVQYQTSAVVPEAARPRILFIWTIESQIPGRYAIPSRAEGASGQTKLQTNSKDTRDVSGMNTITSGLLQDDPNEHINFFSEIPRYLGISGKKLICWLGDHSSSPLVPVL